MKNLIVSFFVSLCFVVSAQESIDLLTISSRLGVPSPYENRVVGKATEFGGMINLKIPVVLDSSNIWYSKLTYLNNRVVSTKNFGDSVANPINIHGIMLQSGWLRKLSRNRSIQLLLVPRLMGDMVNVNSDNIQLGAVALYEKRFNSSLKMKFGAMYNQEMSGPFALPLIDLDWKISDKWWIGGLLPVYSKIKYKFSENSNAGIGHFALMTSYRLGKEAYKNDYIERTCIDVFSFFRQRVSGNFHLEGRVGYTLGRNYEQYNEGESVDFRLSLFSWGDNRTPINYSFKDNLYFNLRMVYNLPID